MAEGLNGQISELLRLVVELRRRKGPILNILNSSEHEN